MSIQLLGKDDSATYDAEILAGRWQSYIDSYVSVGTLLIFFGVVLIFLEENTTHGLSLARLKRPFLRKFVAPPFFHSRCRIYNRRNLPQDSGKVVPRLTARGTLEIRVCVRTYRVFYVPGTEDVLYRTHLDEEMTDLEGKVDVAKERRQRWLDKVKSNQEWLRKPARTTPVP